MMTSVNFVRAGFKPAPTVELGFRSRTGRHEQGTNLPQRRQCVLPLRRRRLSVRCVTTVSKCSCEPAPKKTLKLNSRVSSLLQVCPSLTFQLRNPGSSRSSRSTAFLRLRSGQALRSRRLKPDHGLRVQVVQLPATDFVCVDKRKNKKLVSSHRRPSLRRFGKLPKRGYFRRS